MRTIFLNGLMPERHGHFMRRLAAEYTLTGTRMGDLLADPAGKTINFFDDHGLTDSPLAAELPARIEAETQVLAAELAADLQFSPLGPPPGWQLDEARIQRDIQPRVAGILLQELRFRTFQEHHPVDLVISGADYGSHARVIARVAREMGIPTLDLEHGFFFNFITPEYTRTHGKMPSFFTSEYVNFDNELERQLIQQELSRFPDQGTHFLSLGTPIDTVASACLPRDEAVKALGLDGDKIQVLVVGSWNEARTVQKLMTAQLDTIAAYEDLFTSLAARDFSDRTQLVIKLHPADAHPDVIDGVRAGLELLAERCGLPRPLIKGDMLPEVLSACDVVLAMGFSSVLYDAFLLGKPAVVYFPRFLVYCDQLNDSTLPLRAGVCEATTEGADAWHRLEAFLEPARREKFARDRDDFTQKYGLHHRPVDEKCDAVLNWIAVHLAGR